jgi:hypothetical protein
MTHHSVENVSIHYSFTIQEWHKNWQSNRDVICKSYGERWYRLWNVFLAWSWRIGMQGTSECFQLVAHKNIDSFDRRFSVGAMTKGPLLDPATESPTATPSYHYIVPHAPRPDRFRFASPTYPLCDHRSCARARGAAGGTARGSSAAPRKHMGACVCHGKTNAWTSCELGAWSSEPSSLLPSCLRAHKYPPKR